MASVGHGPPRPRALSGRWSDVALGITWKEARRPAFKVPRETRALCCCPLQTHHRRRSRAAPQSRVPRDSRALAAHDSLVCLAFPSQMPTTRGAGGVRTDTRADSKSAR